MEAEGAVRIYQRSEEKRKLRYLPFVGDGDSKAYSSVQQAVPYGHAVYIEKEECIAHVTKRMGTNLRALVAKNKGTTLIHIMTKVNGHSRKYPHSKEEIANGSSLSLDILEQS